MARIIGLVVMTKGFAAAKASTMLRLATYLVSGRRGRQTKSMDCSASTNLPPRQTLRGRFAREAREIHVADIGVLPTDGVELEVLAGNRSDNCTKKSNPLPRPQ